MAEFDPRQLDQLEDALEHIDDLDDLESLGLSADLEERLGEYQDVLALCRDAFPIEDPSDALLSGVLAEAHEVTRRTRATPEPGTWRKFWERWRGTLIPGAALAGTAAAILFWLEPDAALDSAEQLVRLDDSDEAKTDERDASKDDSPSKPASEPTVEPDPKPEVEPESDSGSAPTAGGGAERAIEAEPDAVPSKKKSKPSPAIEPEPEPAPEPLSKEDTWQRLADADRLRRKGRCVEAQQLYTEVDNASSDNNAAARAKAGIGLCFEQQGLDGQASIYLTQARSSSPGVDSWIERERDEQPQPGELDKKAEAAPKAKKSAPKKKKPSKKNKLSEKDKL